MIFAGIVYLFQKNHVYSQPKRAKYRITLVISDRLLDCHAQIYSSALKNWNVKQGVSERSVDELREYANTPKFYGTNSSKQKSIRSLAMTEVLYPNVIASEPVYWQRSNPLLS